MASTFIQFRTDEDIKIKASSICEQLGIDLQTYMRMCLSRLISNNGIPFSMTLEKNESKGLTAMKAASQIAMENNIADMTLEEINQEIMEVRKNK